MKILIRFLSVCTACFALGTAYGDSPIGGPGPSFANSGGISGNRTVFTGSAGALNNNQWNAAINPNPLGQQRPVADFGNCNSLILRCAQPKCAGCTTMELALPIVKGCVKSNPSCEQYGDDLIQTLAAQMVSAAIAKATEAQNAATTQAANAAAAQSNTQIEQMQAQMMQMQQQMQEQSAQSAAAVQQALEEQKQLAAQQAQAAAQAASASAPDKTITNAVNAGVSADVLAREQIGGQILTQLENSDVAMKDLKNTMQNVFDYARCDSNGNNCQGPRRVKAFKDKANKFFDPYDAVLDELYDALVLAQSLGVDITDIYMMLNGSCNVWGQYMCETCSQNQTEKIDDKTSITCDYDTKTGRGYWPIAYENDAQGNRRVKSQQPHCTLLKMLNNQEDIQQNWLDMDAGSSGGIRVACASDAIDNSVLFKNRKKQSTIDIETLRRIIAQDAPSVIRGEESAADAIKWCATNSDQLAVISNLAQLRRLPDRNLCVKNNNLDAILSIGTADNGCKEDSGNDYINSAIALCSTHAYNIGSTKNPTSAADKQMMADTIALKTTIITQQMKRQYDFLDVTMKRLKTQMEKSILVSKLQAAGGDTTDDSSTSASKSSKGNVRLNGARDCNEVYSTSDMISCLNNNLSVIRSASNKTDARKQLKFDSDLLKGMSTTLKLSESQFEKCGDSMTNSSMTDCINAYQVQLRIANDNLKSGTSTKIGQDR